MADSLIDRYVTSWSLDGRGAITRSIGDAATSGFIRDGAAHWSIESYIPIHTHPLIDHLLERDETTDEIAAALKLAAPQIESIVREQTGFFHGRFTEHYHRVDPDNDSYDPNEDEVNQNDPATSGSSNGESSDGASEAATLQSAAKSTGDASKSGPNQNGPSPCPSEHKVVGDIDDAGPRADASGAASEKLLEVCKEALELAGYRQLSREDVEKCVGVASGWGVPLHVDFDLFDQLLIYARGDIVGTRLRRRLRRLYRAETVNVPIYQRMFILFRLKNDVLSQEELNASKLHLRMFKNIPKQDVDMLLPGTTVKITKIDRVKIIVPSLGGMLMTIRKIAQFMLIFAALTLYSTAILAGLIIATIGYIVKSVLSYFQTKNRYLLNLTRNLYFQKLDTNAGAAYRLFQQTHRQRVNEHILAYYALITSEQPASARRLRRKCERIVREAIGVEIDFQMDRAIENLQTVGLVTQSEDRWTT